VKEIKHHKDRVTTKILNDVNTFLRQSLADPRLRNVSVTKVVLTPDMSVARLYWDTFDPNNKSGCEEAVKSAAPKIRSLLAKSLKARITPEIKFTYDAQYEAEHAIDAILKDEIKDGRGF